MNKFHDFIFDDIKNIKKVLIDKIQMNEYNDIEQFYLNKDIKMYAGMYCFSGYLDEEAFIVYKDVSNRYILSTKNMLVEIPYVFFEDHLGLVVSKKDDKIFLYNTDPHSNRYLKIIDNNMVVEEKFELVRNPNKGSNILNDSLSNVGKYLSSYNKLDNKCFDNYNINYSEKNINKIISNNESIICKFQYLWYSKSDIERNIPAFLTGSIDYKLEKYWGVNNFAYVKDGEYKSLIYSDCFDSYLSFIDYLQLYDISIEHNNHFKEMLEVPLSSPNILYTLREIINEYLELDRLDLEDSRFNFYSNNIEVVKNESVKKLILERNK